MTATAASRPPRVASLPALPGRKRRMARSRHLGAVGQARAGTGYPHPGPLPQAGEGAWLAMPARTTPPLPSGEGRGEGEGNRCPV